MIIQIRGLDVWGNETDGFEVNDVYGVQAEIEIDADCTNKQLIQALIDNDVLYPGNYEFDDFGAHPEIHGNIQLPNGKPIIEVRTKE